MWRNQLQLERTYSDPEFRKSFSDLYALHVFAAQSFTPLEYRAPADLCRAIKLTPSGQDWADRIQSSINDITLQETCFALFMEFFHQDLFIDVATTDADTMQKIISEEIIERRRRHPWVYEKLLYDRFFELFPTNTDELSYEETTKLLEDTPQGVFQVGPVLAGPFGILRSAASRFHRPPRTVALWHCSDVSCNALHAVRLTTGKNKISQARDLVSQESRRMAGPPSEWDKFFDNTSGRLAYYDDMQLISLPWLLANAFSERELRSLLAHLIDQYPSEIRARFPANSRFRSIFAGGSERISTSLPKGECLQLILTLHDNEIVKSLESLIDTGVVNIPPTEIRVPVVSYRIGSWYDLGTECSRFGVRSDSMTANLSLSRMRRMITELYQTDLGIRELEWKLRHITGDSVHQKLDTYIYIEDPKKMVSHLVLDSLDHLHKAFEILRYGNFIIPSSSEEEDRLIGRILWKLGFSVREYPLQYGAFWDRLERLRELARTQPVFTERDVESVRSTGVNFFVSLEEILDQSLSFATWVLLSDHGTSTDLSWNLDDSRRFMASRLGGVPAKADEIIKIDSEGRNTLFALVKGFAALATVCRELVSNEASSRRSPGDFPGYHRRTDLFEFPFLHTVLILDLPHPDQTRLLALLDGITSDLERSQVMNIRNRIDHSRPDFPKPAEVESCCKAVADVVERNAGVWGRTLDLSRNHEVS